MRHLIGIGISLALLGSVACGQEKPEEPMKLTAVCSPTPAQMVTCTWIPFEEKHRTEAEQKLYKERN